MEKKRLSFQKLVYALFAALLTVILIVGGLGFYEVNRIETPLIIILPQAVTAFEKASYKNDLSRLILFYDEVLTQSARNYAFTRDKKWKNRYLAAEPELDDCIRNAILAGGEKEKRLFESIDSANKVLVIIEHRSIACVDSGKNSKACELLESSEYWRHKEVYKNGLVELSSEQGRDLKEAIRESDAALTSALDFGQTTAKSGKMWIIIGVLFAIFAAIIMSTIGIRFLKAEERSRESEERFKVIFERSNDAIMLLTEKGFFDCNTRTLELFGFRNVEEFSRVHPADISPPNQPDGQESFPAAMRKIKTAFETGSNRFEWVHRRTDGVDFPAEVLLSAFNLNNKRVLQATVRDISERKRAELALQENEKKYRSLVETTGTGFLIIDMNGRVLDANREYVRLSGHRELKEIIGRRVVEWTAEKSRSTNAEAVARCASEGIIRNLVIEYIGTNGETVPVEINATVNGEGEHTRIISLCRDITERRNAELALVESEKMLRKKNAEILEFTNTVTHDLKKPLTVMKTVCSLTKSSAASSCDPEIIEATQIGAEAIGYMQDMLDDLLVCARLEAGTQELVLGDVSCKETAEQILRRLKYPIEEKKIRVSLSEKDLCVRVDPKQFERLFMNLIGNAINYIGDRPEKHIEIRWEQKDGQTIFSVRDNGIGIPPETQEHLFTKFKRGANVSGISGTGLGLSIVKGIVVAHGGKIWFESKVGEGTSFHFTLG